MIITEVESAPERPNPHGVGRKPLYDHEHGQIAHLALLPGQELRKHVTPVDAVFYVLEGECEVEIGDEVRRVGRDTLVESPKGHTSYAQVTRERRSCECW